MTDQPFLLVLAGPNGSGKSTLTKYLASAQVDFGTYINPDEIAATIDLPEPYRSAQAQTQADFQRETCLLKKLNFSFETVMSHPSKIDFMLRAHDAGYDVTLYFIATSDPEINVERVSNRVSTGGHGVPEDRIRARYWRSLALLCHAALVARRTVAFDNSALVPDLAQWSASNPKTGLRPVAELIYTAKDQLELTLEAEVPEWVFNYLVKPLDEVVKEADGHMRLTIHQKEGPLS